VAGALATGLLAAAGAGPRAAPARQQALVIDHRAVADFDRLPAEYVRAASELRFLLRSASIGWNIDIGLNCLGNDFPDGTRRSWGCDRELPRDRVIYSSIYSRRRWVIELRGNPGWWDKVSDFTRRVNAIDAAAPFDVVGFNFNYGDGLPGSSIATDFFKHDPNARFGNVAVIEALEKAHPDKTIVWWSMALPRKSATNMESFNRQIRAYAVARKKVFMDLADIESHRPDGSACTDNEGRGIEALCAEYTREVIGGHLNALGSQRAAKAIWVLMARLAGWTG
jgi:hypothetical protein